MARRARALPLVLSVLWAIVDYPVRAALPPLPMYPVAAGARVSSGGSKLQLERAPATADGQEVSSRLTVHGEGELLRSAPDDAPAAVSSADGLEGPPVLPPPIPRLDSFSGPSDSNANENRPITLHFRNADLTAVLDAFAQFTGLNIVVGDQVRGMVSLRLNEVPWRSAFDALLDAHGLAMEWRGNVIWVAPAAALAARERQRFEAHARVAELEPLASRMFRLRYPRAEEVRRLLTEGGQRVLSKRGSALAEPRTNLLFVTDLDARLAQIAELIASIDQPARQVLIEARIIEGDTGFSRNLGARMALHAGRGGKEEGTFSVGAPGEAQLDLSARPLGGFDVATAGLTLFRARATPFLNLELSALEAEGRGRIMSSPRVVTADRTKAIIEQGAELPYQAKAGHGVSGVQFRRATLKLEVEPQITPDNRVVLDLDVAKDSVGEQTASGPAIHTKHVRTRVEVESGGTVSIGGIYESSDREDRTRVPWLGKIPVVGMLFRHQARRQQHSELLLFITPRVVR